VYYDNDLESKDMTNSTNSEEPIKAEIVYGRIINDGSDGGDIDIDRPVPLRHKMNVGEKTRRAMALKLAGASYAAIAEQLGYNDASAARKAVMRGMKSSLQENASELRNIHYARLEHMLMLLWSDVVRKDLPSMSAALAIMDRMDKLFGLSAAQSIDINTSKNTVFVAEGDKESYIKALQEAGAQIARRVSSSSPDSTEDMTDEDETE
jgi:hypothetical protein